MLHLTCYIAFCSWTGQLDWTCSYWATGNWTEWTMKKWHFAAGQGNLAGLAATWQQETDKVDHKEHHLESTLAPPPHNQSGVEEDRNSMKTLLILLALAYPVLSWRQLGNRHLASGSRKASSKRLFHSMVFSQLVI